MEETISRIDRSPSKDLLARSIIDGSFGRKDDLKSFLDMLYRIRGNYAIFLDGEWGVGKTFFVWQTIAALKSFSTQAYLEDFKIDKSTADQIAQAVKPSSWSEGNAQVPIYFNAWKYDFAGNPVVPLLDSLIESFPDQSDARQRTKSIRDKTVSLIGDLSFGVGFGPASVVYSPSDSIENARSEDLTDSISIQKDIRKGIMQILKQCLTERGKRAVLFIDELDRCRPDFAAQVLETTKFLFDQDFLTLVFTVNSKALSSIITSRYGNGIDGARYLMRFYDRKISLHGFNSMDYLLSISELEQYSYPDLINTASALADSRQLTMRDLNRCVTYLDKAFISICQHGAIEALHGFASSFMIDLALHFGSTGITPREFFSDSDLTKRYVELLPTYEHLASVLLQIEDDYFARSDSKTISHQATDSQILQSRMMELLDLFINPSPSINGAIPYAKQHDLRILSNMIRTCFELQ